MASMRTRALLLYSTRDALRQRRATQVLRPSAAPAQPGPYLGPGAQGRPRLDAVVARARVRARAHAVLQLRARTRGQEVEPCALQVRAEAQQRARQQRVLARREGQLPGQAPAHARLPAALPTGRVRAGQCTRGMVGHVLSRQPACARGIQPAAAGPATSGMLSALAPATPRTSQEFACTAWWLYEACSNARSPSPQAACAAAHRAPVPACAAAFAVHSARSRTHLGQQL